MRILVDGDVLNKLNKFTSKNQIRFLLGGISFKRVGDEIEIAATDGAALAVYHHELSNCEEMEQMEQVILNLQDFKFGKRNLVEIIGKDGKYYIRETGKQDIMIAPIEGNFPKYDEVIYKGEERVDSYVKLNWKYLKIIHDTIGPDLYVTPFRAPRKENSAFKENTNPCVWRNNCWTIVLMPIYKGD